MSIDTFTVVVTLETTDTPDGVDMKWYSGHDPLKALLAVGQCIEHHENPGGTYAQPVRMLSVRLDVTKEEDVAALAATIRATTPVSDTSDTSNEKKD